MAKLLIALIRVYQKALSPFFPASCRFYPSCSEYVVQALRVYGVWRGLLKGAWRVLRCQPLSRGGVDLPIPSGNRVIGR
ncbi:MAG: membrane protein insertion efficiency factor YidD [Candidatus Tectomicrobia bacterium]|nr:membrane protein insertion efficiency factor YidD [Candidatus Tectomicrobia bacterium]